MSAAQPDRPAGFLAFWARTLAELDAVDSAAEHSAEELRFSALGGARIGAYLARASEDGPRPLIVHGHGYGSTGVEVQRGWVAAGAQVCGVDVRGYGRSIGALPELSPEGYLLTGVGDPEHAALRGAVCDVLRAVEVTRGLVGAAASRVVMHGRSFAGGLAVMAEALRPAADLLVLEVPSLAWHEERARLAVTGSGRELARHLRTCPERAEATLRALARFDALHFARAVRCPVIVGLGERDVVVPASTVEALFARLAGPRELVRLPVSHSDEPQESLWASFERDWLRLVLSGRALAA